MQKKVLTIVVPMYNAQMYIRTCLKSFCDEGVLNDIEVLVINDGSTDDSLKVVEEFVHNYPSVYRVVTKENGGHGSGINYGIKYATGRYFKVVDADDWVDTGEFIKLVHFLKRSASDIVYSGFLWVYDEGQSDLKLFRRKAELKEPFPGVIYEKEYFFDDIAEQAYIKMHNMTIRTEILTENNIILDEHCYYVDTEYILYPIPYVKTISFLAGFVYLYRIGRQGQSIGIQKMQQYERNYDKVLNSLLQFYKSLGHAIPCTFKKKQYIARLIARVVAGKIKIMLSFPASNEKKKQLVNFESTLKQDYPEIFNSNVNKSIALLRKTRYASYAAANLLVKRKYQ